MASQVKKLGHELARLAYERNSIGRVGEEKLRKLETEVQDSQSAIASHLAALGSGAAVRIRVSTGESAEDACDLFVIRRRQKRMGKCTAKRILELGAVNEVEAELAAIAHEIAAEDEERRAKAETARERQTKTDEKRAERAARKRQREEMLQEKQIARERAERSKNVMERIVKDLRRDARRELKAK